MREVVFQDAISTGNCAIFSNQFGTIDLHMQIGNQEFRYSDGCETKEIQQLAQWLEDLWDDVPAFEFSKIPVTFEYSHREHVGEGYFYIRVREGNEVYSIYVSEQLGTSNLAEAESLRGLL